MATPLLWRFGESKESHSETTYPTTLCRKCYHCSGREKYYQRREGTLTYNNTLRSQKQVSLGKFSPAVSNVCGVSAGVELYY